MRSIVISLAFFLQVFCYAQSHAFYFEKQNLIDSSKIFTYSSFYNFTGFVNTLDDHLLLSYHDNNFYPHPLGFHAKYIKFDTLGNIKWKKISKSNWIIQIKDSCFIGSNDDDHTIENAFNFYDPRMNVRRKVIYEPDSLNYYSLQAPRFNYIETINNRTLFKYFCYRLFPQEDRIYITGDLDSNGVISNKKNEPFIYNLDSLNCDLGQYNLRTAFMGNYNSRSYFLNFGNFAGSSCSSQKRYAFSYICWYDSTSNKYNYYDIKIDSLSYIGGVFRTSNSSILVYGSRKFQPYIFSVNFNGTVNWAKK